MVTTASTSRAYYCDTPAPGDEGDLQRLHALAMPGALALSLRVSPDHRQAAAIQGDRRDTVVVRRRTDGKVVAAGSRRVRELWINGRAQRVGYLSGLRNTPGVRLPRRLIVEAFETLSAMRRPDEADYDLTSIIRDNHAARRALERGIRGLPTYSPIGELLTLTVPTGSRRDLKPPLRRLGADDLPAVTALLQHAAHNAHGRPSWTQEMLLCPETCRGLSCDSFIGYEEAGELIACGAIWDQRAFKQTVVAGLSPALLRWRPLINLGCCCVGRVGLPRRGTTLAMVYASHLAIPDDRRDVWRRLLDGLRALASRLDAKMLVFGVPATGKDMIHRPLGWRAWQTRSVLYAVHHGPPPELDNRPVWPEVAVL